MVQDPVDGWMTERWKVARSGGRGIGACCHVISVKLEPSMQAQNGIQTGKTDFLEFIDEKNK